MDEGKYVRDNRLYDFSDFMINMMGICGVFVCWQCKMKILRLEMTWSNTLRAPMLCGTLSRVSEYVHARHSYSICEQKSKSVDGATRIEARNAFCLTGFLNVRCVILCKWIRVRV